MTSSTRIASSPIASAWLAATLLAGGTAAGTPLGGDLDGDTDVDVDDLAVVLAAAGSTVPPADAALDLDGDGVVTVLDARKLVLLCTRPRCAVGNNPPQIADQAFTVAENSPVGTPVGTVLAQDPDGDAVTFSIVGGDPGGAFTIGPASGEITVADAGQLDFETATQFLLGVEVEDPSGAASSAAVTVDVEDVEEGGITLEKATNGNDADVAPGPTLGVGDAVSWTYRVENVGNVSLSQVAVTDDQGIAVSCPKNSLSPGESMTCVGSAVAQPCQYANLGTVTGRAPSGALLSASDPSHYFGGTAAVGLEKATNGHDADAPPGPNLGVGDAVTWTYQVTNTGDLGLSDVVVTDDREDAVSCPRSSLAPGESMTCIASGTAVAGEYANVGSVTAEAACGGATVGDADPSHHWTCRACEGKVTALTLRYLGVVSNAYVEVIQQQDGESVFSGVVQPGGGFSFAGVDAMGTLTNQIRIFVNGSLNATIVTSCASPIGPGLVEGDFEVLTGESRLGGTLCPVTAP